MTNATPYTLDKHSVLKDPKEYAQEIVDYFCGRAGLALEYYTDPVNEDRVIFPGIGIKYRTDVVAELHKLADAYYADHKRKVAEKQANDLKKYGRTFI